MAVVSYRLGGSDGVSIEAAKWCGALTELGFTVRTVAGSGKADRIVAGLAVGDVEPPDGAGLEAALSEADVVVAENICSLPLNPRASSAVVRALRGRPAVLRHHDLAWQRPGTAHLGPPPDDPAWTHVTVNRLSRRQLAAAGIPSTTLYNRFDPAPPPDASRRTRARRLASIDPAALVVLQPTRAIERKGVASGLRMARALGGHFWLTGRAEEGYEPRLEALVRGAGVPVSRGVEDLSPELTVADAYAACDVVVLPSSWEGFGNPALEGSMACRPVAVGDYAVGRELERIGFSWLDASDPAGVGHHLSDPVSRADCVARNRRTAEDRFSLAGLAAELSELLAKALPGGCRDDGGQGLDARRRTGVQ